MTTTDSPTAGGAGPYVVRYRDPGVELVPADGRWRPIGLVYVMDISPVGIPIEPTDARWHHTKHVDEATIYRDRSEADEIVADMAAQWPEAAVLDVAEAAARLPYEAALPAGVDLDTEGGGLTIPVRSTNNLPGRLTVYVTQYGDLALSAQGGDCAADEPTEVIVTLGAGQIRQLGAMFTHVADHGTRHHRIGVAWVCRWCGHGTTAFNPVVEVDGHLAHNACENDCPPTDDDPEWDTDEVDR